MASDYIQIGYCVEHDHVRPNMDPCPGCHPPRDVPCLHHCGLVDGHCSDCKMQVFPKAVRPGTKYVTLPHDAGQPISMCVFQDRLILACQFAVYRWQETNREWEQLLAIARPPVPTRRLRK